VALPKSKMNLWIVLESFGQIWANFVALTMTDSMPELHYVQRLIGKLLMASIYISSLKHTRGLLHL
jgi:hypothetical protein